MPRLSIEEAFGLPTKRVNDLKSSTRLTPEQAFGKNGADFKRATREQAEHVASAGLEVGFMERALKKAGFENVPVTEGPVEGDPMTQVINEDNQLKQLAAERAATQEFRETVEALRTLPARKSVRDINVEQLQATPAVLRPFAVGAAQTSMRSASLIARGFSLLGFDTDEVADELSREAGEIGEAQVLAGAGQVEQAATSAVSSLMQVLVGGSVGLGTKGIAVAFGVSAANDAITEGRDAGLEGVHLAKFAAGQGIIEAATTLVFNKLLGPGVERLGQLGKKEFAEISKKGINGILKKFALTSVAELPEEITVELLQAMNSQLSGVDPSALTPDNILKMVQQVTLATLMTAGATTGLETVASRGAKPATEPSVSEPEAQPAVLPPREESIRVTKKHLARLKAEAQEDKLTGLGNRRVDQKAVELLFKRADRQNQQVSLVSFDIANFKALNDTLGLEAGDKALQIIADSIQAEIRGERKGRGRDVAGVATRPGGDEFNILLPNTDTAGAQALADRIAGRVDEALKAEGIQEPAKGRPVFAAPGVVTRQPNDARTVEALRTEADFAVKAHKKKVKTELGVPLSRDEAELGEKAPAQAAPPAISEETGAVAPVEEKAVSGAPTPSKAISTPATVSAAIKAAPQKLTPSQLKAATEGKTISVRKRVKKTIASELKAARADVEGGGKGKFTAEGFPSVKAFSDRKLGDLKASFGKSAKPSPADISRLLQVARAVLPPAERGKLIPGIAKITTQRQALAQLGRIEAAVERFGAVVERDRLAGEQKQLKKMGRKIPVPLREMFGDDTINALKVLNPTTMTAGQAKDAADQIASIRGMVRELNDLKLGTQKKGANELAATMVEEMKAAQPKVRPETGKVSRFRQFIDEQNTKPEELLDAMGPQTSQALHQSLKAGEEKTLRVKQEFAQTFARKFDLKKLQTWSAKAGKKAKTASFTLASGKKVTLTYMEMAEIIAAYETSANRAALEKDGFTLARIKHDPKIKVTEKDLDLITEVARKKDQDIIKFAREAKRYLNQDLQPQYDQAFQDLNNYSNIVDDYLPIRRNREDFLRVPTTSDPNVLNKFTLEQLRETKERTGSNASVLISGLDSLLSTHVNRMSLYIGQARPLRNINILLAMPAVAREMDARFGTQRRAFLKARMDHAVSSAVGFNTDALTFANQIGNKIVSNTTIGVLGLNPWVAMKQVASFMTAMTQMDAKFLMRGLAGGSLRPSVMKRMMEHSPQAWTRYNNGQIRLVGAFEDPSGQIHARKGFSDRMMTMITTGDKVVISSIWRGAELEITETTDLKPGSTEFYAAVNKRFNQVVDRTQPATSVLDQAGLALEGRTNSFAKLAGAMFMSQRNQNYTMIRRAIRKGGPEMYRDLGLVMVGSAVAVALVDMARATFYGFNEDKEAADLVLEGLWDVVESNLSLIFGSQAVVEAFNTIKKKLAGEKGGVRRRPNVVSASLGKVLDGFSDLGDALLVAGKTIESGPSRGKSQAIDKLLSAVENLSVGIGSLTGVPVSTPVQIIKAVGRQVWTDDYSVLYKERTKLRGLDKQGKLSDFQRERLAYIDEAFELTNLATRLVKEGAVSREDANQYIGDRMQLLVKTLETVEDRGTVTATITPKEKPPADEVLLREFYKEHGEAVFNLTIQHKEATRAESNFNKFTRSEQRRILRQDPEQAAKIRGAKRSRRALALLTKLREKLSDPRTSPGDRASLNRRVKAILESVTP